MNSSSDWVEPTLVILMLAFEMIIDLDTPLMHTPTCRMPLAGTWEKTQRRDIQESERQYYTNPAEHGQSPIRL